MTQRNKRRIEQARGLRDRLKDEGRHMDSQIVQDILRTLQVSHQTNVLLHRDNMELRKTTLS